MGLPVANSDRNMPLCQGITHINVWSRGTLRYIWNQVDLVAVQAIVGFFEDERLLIDALVHPSALPPLHYREEEMPNLSFRLVGKGVVQRSVEGIIRRFYHGLYRTNDIEVVRRVGASARILTQCAESIGLDAFLVLGRPLASRIKEDRALRESVLASVFESLLGAMAHDRGSDKAMAFFSNLLLPVLRTELLSSSPPITGRLSRSTELSRKSDGRFYRAYLTRNYRGQPVVRVESSQGRYLITEQWETARSPSEA